MHFTMARKDPDLSKVQVHDYRLQFSSRVKASCLLITAIIRSSILGVNTEMTDVEETVRSFVRWIPVVSI